MCSYYHNAFESWTKGKQVNTAVGLEQTYSRVEAEVKLRHDLKGGGGVQGICVKILNYVHPLE